MPRYLAAPDLRAAAGSQAQALAQLRRELGAAVEPLTLHWAAPELFVGAWGACRESLLVGAARREVKEAVATAVSRLNRCPYCVDAHAIFLDGLTAHDAAEALGSRRDGEVHDPALRAAVAWAEATRTPGAAVLRAPPFEPAEAPELLGTAVFFHYVNRMVTVLLGESPLPGGGRRLRRPLRRLAGWYFSRALRRPKAAGASLPLLPPAELPLDLAWARASPHVAGAFARFAHEVERGGRASLPPEARERVLAHLEPWTGADLGPGRGWVERAVHGLDDRPKAAARLALLTAIAPHQLDDGVVGAFAAYAPGDRPLVEALAWGAFAAARKIGTWLGDGAGAPVTQGSR